MSDREVVITSAVGLHARPAARFVKAAAATGMPVTIRKQDGESVNAASILAVLTLDIACGDHVVVSADDEAVLDLLAEVLAAAD